MLIIPAIDIRNGNCVRLFQGDYSKETVYGTNPAEQAKIWEKAGAVLIHAVDLDGAKEKHPVNLTAVKNITSSVNIRIELGGGIRTLADAQKAFDAGVYRVILGTAVCQNPLLAKDFIKEFTAEKIVVGIDTKGGMVAVNGWLETNPVDVFELAQRLSDCGVTRFIFTDVFTDGALSGPNLDFISALCSRIPHCGVIASGGISSVHDITDLRGLDKPNLEGVIVGKALYDGKITFAELEEAAENV